MKKSRVSNSKSGQFSSPRGCLCDTTVPVNVAIIINEDEDGLIREETQMNNEFYPFLNVFLAKVYLQKNIPTTKKQFL